MGQIPPSIIFYEGPYDMEKLYRGIYSFLDARLYKTEEKNYKNKPPELEIALDSKRNVTTYVRYVISTEFHFWGIKEIEMTVGNERKKMKYARIKITLSGEVVTGYDDLFKTGYWQSSYFVLKLRQFIDKWILKKDLDSYEDDLYYEIVALDSFIKETLGMESATSAF